jgi:glycine cleavage system H protein
VKAGDACATVESVKAASDVYAPIGGEVVEGNAQLADQPELINQDPYGAGWIMKLRPASAGDLGGLMDAAGYTASLEE